MKFLVWIAVSLVGLFTVQTTHPPHVERPDRGRVSPVLTPVLVGDIPDVMGAVASNNEAVAAWVAIEEQRIRDEEARAEEARKAEEARRLEEARSRVSSSPIATRSGTCGGNVECFLPCTRAHESDTSGGYGAVSPGGTYRGAYQFDAGTWRASAIGAGFGEYANTPVDQVPAAVQDAVAAYLYSMRGNQPWGGRC